MFLRNQFFFFRVYFKILDKMNCIVFSWNQKLEYFELTRSLSNKIICYCLTGFHFLFMCVASYVFQGLKMKGANSDVYLALHLTILIAAWYGLLFRSCYTTKAEGLVKLMNHAIFLEKFHFHSKLP